MDELKLTYLKIHRELGIENTMFWPKGCYFIPSSGTVYMNKNHTASKVDDATSELTRSICTEGILYTHSYQLISIFIPEMKNHG